MTEARREIFIRQFKVLAQNIRYEKHCIKDHLAVQGDYTQCPLWEHEADLRFFRDCFLATLRAFRRRT